MLGATTDSNGYRVSVPAAVAGPDAAHHAFHERVTARTNDHEDHTFCGIMFDVECLDTCPLAFLEISSVSVRGDLGPLTVWALPGGLGDRIYEPSRADGWQLIYEREHSPSPNKYEPLILGDQSVKLEPNTKLGLYIHSKRGGDRSIVYDNQRLEYSYENMFLRIHPGLAHLGNEPFGEHGGWWWGSPWSSRREFVGCIDFGVCYKLWSPAVHQHFNANFRRAVKCLLLIACCPESQLRSLPDGLLPYMLSMCRYDWFDIEALADDDIDEDMFLLRESADDDAWNCRNQDGKYSLSSSLWPHRHLLGSHSMIINHSDYAASAERPPRQFVATSPLLGSHSSHSTFGLSDLSEFSESDDLWDEAEYDT